MKPPIAPAPWFVYMLECKGGRIYTGVSPDVGERYAKHRAGKGGAFTRSFPPRRVLATMRCADRGEALSTEHALKQLERAQKLTWARKNRPLTTGAARGTRPPKPRAARSAGARSRSS